MSDEESVMQEAIREAELNDTDDGVFVKVKPPREPAQVYSVRIPVDRLEELRRVAAAMFVPPSTMIREWVLERLDGLNREAAVEKRFNIRISHVPPSGRRLPLDRFKRRDDVMAWVEATTKEKSRA